jgi:hypothetical protein
MSHRDLLLTRRAFVVAGVAAVTSVGLSGCFLSEADRSRLDADRLLERESLESYLMDKYDLAPDGYRVRKAEPGIADPNTRITSPTYLNYWLYEIKENEKTFYVLNRVDKTVVMSPRGGCDNRQVDDINAALLEYVSAMLPVSECYNYSAEMPAGTNYIKIFGENRVMLEGLFDGKNPFYPVDGNEGWPSDIKIKLAYENAEFNLRDRFRKELITAFPTSYVGTSSVINIDIASTDSSSVWPILSYSGNGSRECPYLQFYRWTLNPRDIHHRSFPGETRDGYYTSEEGWVNPYFPDWRYTS